jgi:hypothetical protein
VPTVALSEYSGDLSPTVNMRDSPFLIDRFDELLAGPYGQAVVLDVRKQPRRANPRPRLRFVGAYSGARKGPVAAFQYWQATAACELAARAPFCRRLLRSPQRAVAAFQYSQATAACESRPKLRFAGVHLRSAQFRHSPITSTE